MINPYMVMLAKKAYDKEMRKIRDFGFLGDKDNAVIVDFLPGSPVVRYAIRHAHNRKGKCLKSAYGLCN